ncbi:hypothetical protein [Streptomyces lunaelactis]|nr:hypothetical protein [Streptomyces lunaelactis]
MRTFATHEVRDAGRAIARSMRRVMRELYGVSRENTLVPAPG